MNDIAILVEKISKKFYIGRRQEAYKTLRDTLADAFTAPVRKVGKLLRGHATGASDLDEAIWALEDVSFNVRKGEVIGIIGRNGAGLVTLNPLNMQFYEGDAVAFHVMDSFDLDSARGDWRWPLNGVMRPLMKWQTTYSPQPISEAELNLDKEISGL